MEELEEISRRCNEAALDAERIKDKELLRARRAREVSAMFVNIGVCVMCSRMPVLHERHKSFCATNRYYSCSSP